MDNLSQPVFLENASTQAHRGSAPPLIISGAGPAGMLAALAIAAKNTPCLLFGPQASPADKRTTALMLPAIVFLQSLIDWEKLKKKSAPLAAMQIIDVTGRLIRSPTVSFDAREVGEEAFGYNIANIDLNHALQEAIERQPLIRWIPKTIKSYAHAPHEILVQSEDGNTFSTPLVIAADGKKSLARQSASIGIMPWDYPQTAVVLTFLHEKPHKNICREFHTAYGPFTQIPLPGNMSSLVWVTQPSNAAVLLELTSKRLAEKVEQNLHSILGKIHIDSSPQAWPLSGFIAKDLAKNRTLLVGEAAHVFPPIGAQGLNLTIRDIKTVQKALLCANPDAGAPAVLNYYRTHRKRDVQMRTHAVDILNKTLLSNLIPAQLLRAISLKALQRSRLLRHFFMKEGMAPGTSIKTLKEFIQSCL